ERMRGIPLPCAHGLSSRRRVFSYHALRPRDVPGGMLRAHREPLAQIAQRADAKLAEESGPAPRSPGPAVLQRQRTQIIGFVSAEGIAGPFHRIVVKGSDLLRAHTVAREPARNVDVAEALHVCEDFAGSCSGGGTGCREGVADQNDARLPMTLCDVQIDR